jgi:23S rRNA (guanosine2251-2'-O)-methyltransferase
MSKKVNKRKNVFQVYGINNCLPILNSSNYNVIDIFLAQDSNTDFKKLLNHEKYEKNIQFLKKHSFYDKFGDYRTQGIVVTFTGNLVKNLQENKFDKKNSCLLMLDQIEDPQNAGQIIRTSECAGIDGIIFPLHNSFKISNTVLNVSQGAFVNMPLYEVTNISRAIQELKKQDFWVVGIENGLDSKLWNEIDYSGRIVIIVGSEGKGIRKKVLDHCDFSASIPMQGDINSLNVSAAVSAILFERLRQIKYI